MQVAEIILAGLMAIFIPFIAYRKKAFTLSAATAAVVLLAVIALAGIEALSLIVIAFLSLSISEKLIRKKNSGNKAEEISKKTGARDIIQLGANGIPALLCILLYLCSGETAFLCGYTAALAEAFGDSMASSVGSTSHGKTINISTLKAIPCGLSGGISIRGSIACILACAFIAFISYVMGLETASQMIIATIGSIAGCFLDSWLGATIQVKYSCVACKKITEKEMHCGKATIIHSGIPFVDNDFVNISSNAFAASISIAMLLLLRITTINSLLNYMFLFLLTMSCASLMHEIGHLIGCAVCKCKVLAVKLWLFRYNCMQKSLSLSFGEKNNCVFSTENKTKARFIYLSGPGANGLILVISTIALIIHPSVVLNFIALTNAIKFISNIIPTKRSDGYMAFVALKEEA